MSNAGLLRRLASGAYDLLLLLAVLFVSAFLFLILFGSSIEPPKRYFLQGFLFAVSGAYFCWFWLHGGQTLPMKTWRLRIVSLKGDPITPRQACLRYVFAVAGLLFFGAGWCWALFDREGCLLQDRLAGTRLVEF